MLVVRCRADPGEPDGRQLAAHYLQQEVPRAAGRFEELDIGPCCGRQEHVGDQIEHRFNLTLMRVDLGQIADAVARPDLTSVVLV